MKHLLTLTALLVSTLSLAQFTPYNPDADNDQFVGAQDLLAFLPLFGEDWDLDSLVIYNLADLQPPEWCDWPGNIYDCEDDQVRIIPEDADIIFGNAQAGNQSYDLLLPSLPKPIIIFGVDPQTYLTDQFYYYNENQTFTLLEQCRLNTVEAYKMEIGFLMGFNGRWYFNR